MGDRVYCQLVEMTRMEEQRRQTAVRKVFCVPIKSIDLTHTINRSSKGNFHLGVHRKMADII